MYINWILGGIIVNWCSGRVGFFFVVGLNCKYLVWIRLLNVEIVILMGWLLSLLCRYMYLYGIILFSVIKVFNF